VSTKTIALRTRSSRRTDGTYRAGTTVRRSGVHC
jgi:hypothetical protein